MEEVSVSNVSQEPYTYDPQMPIEEVKIIFKDFFYLYEKVSLKYKEHYISYINPENNDEVIFPVFMFNSWEFDLYFFLFYNKIFLTK